FYIKRSRVGIQGRVFYCHPVIGKTIIYPFLKVLRGKYVFIIGEIRTNTETAGEFPVFKKVGGSYPDDSIQRRVITQLYRAIAILVGLKTRYYNIIVKSADEIIIEKLRGSVFKHFSFLQNRFFDYLICFH